MNGIASAHFKCILTIWYSQFSSDLCISSRNGRIRFFHFWMDSNDEKLEAKKRGTEIVLIRFSYTILISEFNSFGNVNLNDKWNHRSAETTNCDGWCRSVEAKWKDLILSGFGCAKPILYTFNVYNVEFMIYKLHPTNLMCIVCSV